MMRKIILPKRYFDNTFIIAEKFSEEIENFFLLMQKCKGEEFDAGKKIIIQNKIIQVIEKARLISNYIIKIFDCYENSDNKSAQELVDEIMIQLEKDIFVGTIDDRIEFYRNGECYLMRGFRKTPGYRFFRVRASDYESPNIQKNADELFHISLSKRAYSNNERFSLAGFPSLYLSTMLPLAWQECGYPQKYYYSEYQYKFSVDEKTGERVPDNELKFLMIYSPDEIVNWGNSIKYSNFDLWLDVIMRYLKTYPLILACSFVNQSGKVPYKQEYIIPQMLMQWVQRNNSKIQGIEYFTCVDISMRTSEWCAYNIVIPAMPPYNDKKYSITLKKKFVWTYPQFYSIPLFNKSYNEEDRKLIYCFVSDIRDAMRKYSYSGQYYDALIKMINICGCLMGLFENENAIDMQLVLHILHSLSENAGSIYNKQLDNEIETKMKKEDGIGLIDESCVIDACDTFKDLYYRFFSTSNKFKSVYYLISKYKDLCWNDSHPHSEVTVLYCSHDKVENSLQWFEDNHILYNVHKIDSSSKTIEYLRKIASETKISLDDFWDRHVESEEWIKDNIDKIKSPIFIQTNDVSRYSNNETNLYEILSFGFDKDIMKRKLLK